MLIFFRSELAQTKEFYGFCNQFLLYNLINCPTRITEHTSTCIDVILTTNPSRCHKADGVPFSESDHLLTYVKILVRGKKYKVKPKCVTISDYLKIDKDALEKRFAECSWEEWFSHDDVNYCSEKLSDLIPVKTLKVRHSSLPWLRNPELTEARRKRDFAHRKALKVQSNEAWNDFRSCRNKVNKMLRLSKKSFLSDSKIFKSKEKVDNLNNFFISNSAIIKEEICPVDTCPSIYLGAKCSRIFSFDEVSEDVVNNHLLALDSQKATGCDEISAKFLKLARTFICKPHTIKLCTKYLETGKCNSFV